MDLSTIATSLSNAPVASGVTGEVDLSVLKTVQNLQLTVASELFGSLGIGTAVDAFA
jgi:hypothetical protein